MYLKVSSVFSITLLVWIFLLTYFSDHKSLSLAISNLLINLFTTLLILFLLLLTAINFISLFDIDACSLVKCFILAFVFLNVLITMILKSVSDNSNTWIICGSVPIGYLNIFILTLGIKYHRIPDWFPERGFRQLLVDI